MNFPVFNFLNPLGHHVQRALGGAVHSVVAESGLRGLRADIDHCSRLLLGNHLADHKLRHVDHLLHVGVEQPGGKVGLI